VTGESASDKSVNAIASATPVTAADTGRDKALLSGTGGTASGAPLVGDDPAERGVVAAATSSGALTHLDGRADGRGPAITPGPALTPVGGESSWDAIDAQAIGLIAAGLLLAAMAVFTIRRGGSRPAA
jgi:hypothetical protein